MKFASLLLALLLAAPAWAQTTIYQQSFEDDDPAYATSATCNDGGTDFFTRTDGSNISSAYEVTGKDGDFFFGAQDIDAEDGDPPENGTCDTVPQRISFDDIDISGFSSLSFAGLFAEDDDGTNQDWDEPDFVHVKYRIDSDDDDDLVNLLFFENDGTTFNAAPLEDTDFDGTGDGTELTSTFAEFTKAIAGTGSTLDIVILFSLDSGDEDIAVDNVRITGTAVNSDPVPDNVSDGDTDDVVVGDTFSATYSFSDPDSGDVVSVVVSGEPANFTATPTDGNPAMVAITFSPDASQVNQSYDVTYTATDGNGGSTSVTVTYTVRDAPTGTCEYTSEAIATSGLTFGSDGGQARFAFGIDNSGNASAASVDIWAMVMDSEGHTILVRTPRTPTVPAGAFYKAGYNQRIPASIADGVYTYTLKAGTYDADDPSMSEICGSETFTITKGGEDLVGKASVLLASDWAEVEILDVEITEASLLVTDEEIRVGPNPTRGAATFAFALAEDGDVSLALYDVQGREVAMVVNGRMVTGPHTVALVETLSPGVYVWQFRAGPRVETGRLTVVR